MSRPKSSFAAFFPTAPSVLHHLHSEAGIASPSPSVDNPPSLPTPTRDSSSTSTSTSLSAARPLSNGNPSALLSSSSALSADVRSPNPALSNGPNPVTLTPVTTNDSSPPQKPLLEDHPKVVAPSRISPFPPPGQERGKKLVYDPEQDRKLDRLQRRDARPRYLPFGPPDSSEIPKDPRLAIPGYTSCAYMRRDALNKQRLRPAPYLLRPYAFDARTSLQSGQATQIVVSGFDHLTPPNQLRAFFSTFGSISEFTNHTDPITGSFLGICTILFQNDTSRPSGPCGSAVDAASRAERSGNGQIIGMSSIKVHRDLEGRKSRRLIEEELRKRRAEQEALFNRRSPSPPPSKSTSTPPLPPKGASALDHRIASRHPDHYLVETTSILPTLRREPYLFLAHTHVPVLGTTIPHMKKRFAMYDFVAVRADRTGYFIIFDNSREGQDECVRCFRECNFKSLFTYTMRMECQYLGNPDRSRSPTPERVEAETRRKAERDRARREKEAERDAEMKDRAERLAPVRGALEQLFPQLRAYILDDLKKRLVMPLLVEALDPANNEARREKYGVSVPSQPRALAHEDSAFVMPWQQRIWSEHSTSGSGSRPRTSPRGGNVFIDERRRHHYRRPAAAIALHRRLQDFDSSEDESGNEQSIRPDEFRDDSSHRARSPTRSVVLEPLKKSLPDMTQDELDDEVESAAVGSARWKKAIAEIRLREATFPDTDKGEDTDVEEPAHGIVDEEVPRPKRSASSLKRSATKRRKLTNAVDTDVESVAEAEDTAATPARPASPLPESTAKDVGGDSGHLDICHLQALEKVRRLQQSRGIRHSVPRQGLRSVQDPTHSLLDLDGWQSIVKDLEDFQFLHEALSRFGVSAASVGDISIWGWKEKTFGDLNRKWCLPHQNNMAQRIEDRFEMTDGVIDGTETAQERRAAIDAQISSHLPTISGYYVPNKSGCARTEGVRRIIESEKSKYLPHRIKVAKQREERQRQAHLGQNDSSGSGSQPQPSNLHQQQQQQQPVLTTGRSNRASNRRLFNEINTHKKAMAAVASESANGVPGIGAGGESIAIRFNQLKKRKKLVKFDRSAIHNWGLYAQEKIVMNDMIIEYVGEVVRPSVAAVREVKYKRAGIGSSYLFRIDEDYVIDATKHGGIARFINHSCTPNCTAKIIRVDGTKRIVIYAARDIAPGEEITYDYKFEREVDEDNRVPCLCGSAGCKGFLN